jgi:hypothetical protein
VRLSGQGDENSLKTVFSLCLAGLAQDIDAAHPDLAAMTSYKSRERFLIVRKDKC